METKKKTKLPIVTLLLVTLLILIGTSYAYFDYTFIGKDNTITQSDISIKLLESNKEIISLENQLPMSDEQGIKQTNTGNVFDFSVETKSASDIKLGYKINIEKLKVDEGYTNLTDDQIKIYLTDTNDNKILGPLKISDLENYNLYEDINIHSKTNNTQVDKYRIRVWIDQDVQVKNWDENTKQQYKFKIGVNTEENEGTYIITYNSNGGTGTMGPSTYKENTQETLRKNTFTRGGYTFKGWSTTTTGEATYKDQNIATSLTTNQNEKNKTLYAIWQPNTYTVTYNPNTTETREEEPIEIDVDYFPIDVINTSKWTLNNGVYESSEELFTSQTANAQTSNVETLASSHLFSSMYKEVNLSEESQLELEYAMTYGKIGIVLVNKNGSGSGISKTITQEELATANYKTVTMTLPKGNYCINIYYTDELNSVVPDSNDQDNVPEVKKLETTSNEHKAYIKNIKIAKHANNKIKSQTYTVGQNNKLQTNNFTKTGYTFKGWHTNKNEINTKYKDANDLTDLETKVKENENINLYAIWDINKYTVNVVVQNGTADTSSKQVEYNKNGTFNLTSNEETNNGVVTCTNGQTGTLKNNILTVSNVTSDTTCKVIFNDEATTTLYEDGTLIINEGVKDRNSNIEKYGTVTNEYESYSNSNSYIIENESAQPWYNEKDQIKRVEIGQPIQPLSTSYWFSELLNIKTGDFTNLETSKVIDMEYMFERAGYDATTFNLEGLSNWDTSNVTNMRSMFYHAGSSATTFNLGSLSNWDTSNVENVNYMFYEAGVKATTFYIGNLENWNVSKVGRQMLCAFVGTGDASNYKSPSWYFNICRLK